MSNPLKSGLNSLKETTRMIISAIDCLKGRKARPDETKICNFMDRRFGVKREDTIQGIKDAVADGSVLKVKYKDSVSYRNPQKFSQKMSNHIMSKSGKCWTVSPQTMKRVLRELRVLCRSRGNGVSKLDIIDSLHSNCHSVDYNESIVDKVLSRALQTGSVKQLSNGNYTLMCGKRIVPRKGDPDQTATSSKFTTEEDFESDVEDNNDIRNNDEMVVSEDSANHSNGSIPGAQGKASLMLRRERPVSKRKKFKKSLGPDFIESSELGLQYMRDSFEPKCDLCQLRSKSNKRGKREELLSCKDCSAKAHPSCMDYSEELAERSSRSPWQCMECKTCDICHDSKDGANMLVCDLCDKGFHMNCQIPVVRQKPIGKWECNECIAHNKHVIQSDNNLNNGNIDPEIAQNGQNIQNTKSEDLEDILKTEKSERILITSKRNSETSSLSSYASNLKENYPEVVPNPQKWSPEDVENFIRNIGFPEQSILFKEQEIDGTSLLLLRRSDVLTGFHMKLGPALKIYSHIMRLQKSD